MSKRMTDERLAELERTWKEHFDALCAEYKCKDFKDVISRGEGETWELLQAMKAERERIAELESRVSSLDCRYAGQYADFSGSHCPIDKPCMRCKLEARLDAVEQLCKEAEQTKAGTIYVGLLRFALEGEGR